VSTTTVQRRGGPPWKWLLPILLALLIAALVIVFAFGGKIKDAISGPTATPVVVTQVVVTSTPAPGAIGTPGTPGPGGVVTTTPGPGGSTPLPGGTPIPTVVGLKLGMITHKAVDVAKIQSGADAGDPNFTFYLNPVTVVQKTLTNYGFTGGFTILSPASAQPTPTPTAGADGRPLVLVKVSYQAKNYIVQVVQPGKHGPKGIWLIVSILHSPT
jgi:hypothetical protein